MALSLALAFAVLAFAAAFGASVAGAVSVALVVRVVGIWDAVAVGVRGGPVIGVVRERVVRVVGAVSIGVSRVGVGSSLVLLHIGQAVAVGVAAGIASRIGIEAVVDLPSVWHAVVVSVRVVHVCSSVLLLGIGEAISVPVGPAVRRVEGIGTIGANAGGSCHKHEEKRYQHTRILRSIYLHFRFHFQIKYREPAVPSVRAWLALIGARSPRFGRSGWLLGASLRNGSSAVTTLH